MSIKALSPVVNTNAVLNRNKNISKSQLEPQTKPQKSEAFELPKYNPAFKARIDVDKLVERSEIKNKYLKKSANTKVLTAVTMNSQEFKQCLEEIEKVDKDLIPKMFLLKADDKGNLIAHYGNLDKWKIMADSLSTFPNGKEILKEIFLTKNDERSYPSHENPESEYTRFLASILDKDTMKKIYTTRNENKQMPSSLCQKDGDYAEIIKTFVDDKETLDKITGAGYFIGKEDYAAFFKAYKAAPGDAKKYFIDPDDNILRAFMKNVERDDEGAVCGYIKSLFENNPDILKAIYTKRTLSDNHLMCQDLHDDEAKNTLAKYIFVLIADSDLNAEDSLAVLKANEDFLKSQGIKIIDLLKDYLEDKVKYQ